LKRSSSGRKPAVKVSKQRIDAISEILSLDLESMIKGELDSYCMEFLRFAMELFMNTEVLEKVGRRNERNEDRDCVRWGGQNSSGYILGQRVSMEKPRIRTRDGKAEVLLETGQLLSNRKALSEKVVAKLLSGVSTRRYADVVEGVLQERGIGRQTISRHGIEMMSKKLEEFKERQLTDLDLVAILVDGIHLGDTVHVVALGVDIEGRKRILGMVPGETEDNVVCKQLLANLIDRGLSEVGGYLFVIDGGKGLRKAIRAVYGKRVAVQRCLEHKQRNLASYVPKERQQEIRQKMNAAFAALSLEEAETAFDLLRRELSQIRTSACTSLLDGLGELLTLHRLGVSGALRSSLCTTNCIESLFSSARYYTRNVKRWQKEEQGERWLAAGLLEAEKRLRPLKGYTRLGRLKQSLQKLLNQA